MVADEGSFYDRLWAERPGSPNDDERARLAEIERLLRRVLPLRGPILDVGCGTGWLAAALAAHGAVLGVDTSEEAVAQARRRFPSLDFRKVEEAAPLDEALYALVVCSEVIEHVADQRGLMARLARAAAPGGHVVVTTPNLKVRPYWEALDPPKQPREDWLGRKDLVSLARDAGLRAIVSRSFFCGFTSAGRYRLCGSPRLERIGLRGPIIALAERVGWGLYLSLLARRPA